MSQLQRFSQLLLRRVDVSSLAAFRILFGLLMLNEARYLLADMLFFGVPRYHFHYELFPFIEPLNSVEAMSVVFCVMLLSALGITLGLFFRLWVWLFFITYTYVFLLDQSTYNNHYYLISWLAFLLGITNSDRWLALDNVFFKRKQPGDETVPFWQIFVFRALLFFVYFFGGVAKLNCDWLKGEPMRTWLFERLGQAPELLVYFISLAGTYFDLLVGFMLLWPPTRLLAFLLMVPFHITNMFFFDIGVFPFLALASTILFVEPSTPRKWFAAARRRFERAVAPKRKETAVDLSCDGGISDSAGQSGSTAGGSTIAARVVVTLVLAFLIFHILMPLRHYIYPGNTNWTEEGHFFAWRMKLRDKQGDVKFTVKDESTGDTLDIDPASELTLEQFSKLPAVPNMVLQYAHHLHDQAASLGYKTITVRARSLVGMNGRQPQDLIDPTVDLSQVHSRLFQHATWIVPLTTPLPDPHPRLPYYLLAASAVLAALSAASLARSKKQAPTQPANDNAERARVQKLWRGLAWFGFGLAATCLIQSIILLGCH